MSALTRSIARALSGMLLSGIVALGVAPVAGADQGVTIDPNSPAGVEYALPVAAARRDASGEKNQPISPGSDQAPLFGAGITRDHPATTAHHPAHHGHHHTGHPTGSGGTASSGGGGGGGDPSSVAQEVASSRGASASTALLGGGAAVLLLVVLGGAALRAIRGPERS